MTSPHLFQLGSDYLLFFPRSARLYELSGAAASLVSDLCGAQAAVDAPPLDFPPTIAADEVTLHDDLRELLRYEAQVGAPAGTSPKAECGRNSFHTFSIYLAQACNMSCSYCWNRGGSFGGPAHLMGVADASAITELIARVAEHSTEDRICVNFYGGEPLVNFAVLQQITLDLLRRGEHLGKSVSFTLDTNGSLLHGKKAQFLAQHFANVWVSLDGREEIHNAQRPGKHGEGTWRQVVRNLEHFPNRDILGLRATLTRRSDSYLDTFRQLSSLQVRRIQLEYCHQPGYHQNPGYDALLVPLERQLAELSEFLRHYLDSITRYNSPRDIPVVSNLLHEIARLWRGNRSTRPCGAGINALAVNSRGEIFPCVAFVNQERFKMTLAPGETVPLLPRLQTFDADRRQPCQTCWLRYDCAGGCYTTHFDLAGNARAPHQEYCLAMRSKAELYLWALAQMQNSCPWHLEI